MSRITLLAMTVPFLCSRMSLGSPIWTETFDTGVGRLDQTMGDGDSRYVWQSAGNIHGTFIRDGANDRRYALLGDSLDGNADVFGCSFVVTPLATNVGGHAGSSVGFWNSNSDNTANRLGIKVGGGSEGSSRWIQFRGAYADGGDSIGESSSYVTFDYGTTYFVDVTVNGPLHLAAASIYQGTDATGLWVGSIEESLAPDRAIVFDSLGMGGPFPGSNQWITATIDNLSYTPEPSTSCLLGMIGFFILHRRHRTP